MKKILSVILASCMLFAFTASAEMPTGLKYVVTGTSETTATCDIIVEGDFTAFAGLTAYVKYDPAKVTLNTTKAYDNFGTALENSEAAADYVDKSGEFNTKSEGKYFKYEYGYYNTTDAYKFTGSNYKFATIYFDVVEGQTLAEGDIAIVDKCNNGNRPTFVYTQLTGESTLKGTSLTINSEFTPYVPAEPAKPVISVDPSNPTTGVNNGVVDIAKNDETGAYSVKVKAPIGKKAVIYLNGVAQTGTEISGTATADTTIKVEYVDDDDYSVITYPIIYKGVIEGTTEGVVVFGKGTINEGDEYGIKLTKGDKSTKYAAEFNAAGIFGVAFIDGEGEYTAQAYVNDATGRVVSFTK